MHLRGVRPNPGTGRPGRSGAVSQRDRPRRLSRLAAIKRQLISITERTRRSIIVAQSATGNSTSRSNAPRRPTARGCMPEAATAGGVTPRGVRHRPQVAPRYRFATPLSPRQRVSAAVSTVCTALAHGETLEGLAFRPPLRSSGGPWWRGQSVWTACVLADPSRDRQTRGRLARSHLGPTDEHIREDVSAGTFCQLCAPEGAAHPSSGPSCRLSTDPRERVFTSFP